MVSQPLARITKAILDDENAVLPLSVFQEGQYGVKNVFIGQSCWCTWYRSSS